MRRRGSCLATRFLREAFESSLARRLLNEDKGHGVAASWGHVMRNLNASVGSRAERPERYWQLLYGVIAMMAISSAQYVWALFVIPLQHALGAPLASIQVTFSLFVILQTLLSPAQGFLVDRLGPRLLTSIGAALMAGSWIAAASAQSLGGLYFGYGVLGGLGSGVIYVAVIGLMVQWFPERRGFAAGWAAAGYGFGAIFTTIPIAAMIHKDGYRHAFLVFGLIQGLIAWVAAQRLRTPSDGSRLAHLTGRAGLVATAELGVSVGSMLGTPVFWCLFVMMAMMSTGGLMVISQMAVFARTFGVSHALVWGFAAVPLAMSLDRFTNGLTRPFFGWVSDRIGREQTMAIAFALEGLAVGLLLVESQYALAFVLLSGVVFFGWGEIFALFPATLIDSFGPRQATTKYGFLYMAQGVGALLGGPVAAFLYEHEGSWTPLFVMVVVLDVSAAALALLVLKPLRRKLAHRDLKPVAPSVAL